jgi:4-amino-4-deoxy-L-arabinose transferase-like glycosyltransferase
MGTRDVVQRSPPFWGERDLAFLEVLFLSLILIVAACFRLYQVGQVPPGPHYDEAAAALDALDVLHGRHTVFSMRSYGREMLFVYVAAPLIALLGPTRLALRLPVALVGVLTVLVTYLLARELFDQEDKLQARWTALGAALFLGVSFWHLVLNRLSFRANYLPLTEVLCFFFLFRAQQTGRLKHYLLSGLFLGLSLHTYTAARLVPLVVAIYLGALVLTREGRSLVIPSWRRWVLLGLVALGVCAPLLIFFLTRPEAFLLRARGISILNPSVHHGDFWGLLGQSVLGNLAQFGFKGDEHWVYNLPGRPGLDAIQAALFWLGLALCLVRRRQPQYLFLLLWWVIMLLPSILAPDPIPHSLRAIGTLPVACILSARALTWLASKLPLQFRRWRTGVVLALPVLLSCYLAWEAYSTWHSYFGVWQQHDEVYYAYYGHMADLAEQINRDTDPEAVYIFPVNYDRRGEEYQEYTLELLHRGSVPFHYIVVDDASVTRDLTTIIAGKNRAHLILWTHGDHVDADPRQVLPFLLEGVGRKTDERAFRGYRIATYELPSPATDLQPPELNTTQAHFDTRLRLVAQTCDPHTASGDTTRVALRWEAQQVMAHDYKASLRLFDTQGHLVCQGDSLLLSNEHQATSSWKPGQVVTTYHLLPIRPGTLPGLYELHLILYDPATMRSVQLLGQQGASGGDSLVLGSMEISRPSCGSAVEPEVPLPAVRLTRSIELVGYGLDRQVVVPRETICLVLYWHARAEIAHDYAVLLQLVDESGEVSAEWAERPACPTSQWQAGDLWRDWHDLKIPPGVPAGEYRLVVRLVVAGTVELAQAELGKIEVQARDCLFQMPAIGHPLLARLGEKIRFLGYDLDEEQVRAGETLHLTLYWQALAECDVSYTVFTHLLDRNARLSGQSDGLPAAGALPTNLWLPQEIVIDEHELPVSAQALPGHYLIEIGMYQAASGQRLAVQDEIGEALGDHLLLGSRIRVAR